MLTHPLANLSLNEAIAMQFQYVDVVTRHFNGAEILQAGDYGVVPGISFDPTSPPGSRSCSPSSSARRTPCLFAVPALAPSVRRA